MRRRGSFGRPRSKERGQCADVILKRSCTTETDGLQDGRTIRRNSERSHWLAVTDVNDSKCVESVWSSFRGQYDGLASSGRTMFGRLLRESDRTQQNVLSFSGRLVSSLL